jgi:hypothetical protein
MKVVPVAGTSDAPRTKSAITFQNCKKMPSVHAKICHRTGAIKCFIFCVPKACKALERMNRNSHTLKMNRISGDQRVFRDNQTVPSMCCQ